MSRAALLDHKGTGVGMLYIEKVWRGATACYLMLFN